MVHHGDAAMASYGCQHVRRQIWFALVWGEYMTMALNGEWLVLEVKYALYVGGDKGNLQRIGYF